VLSHRRHQRLGAAGQADALLDDLIDQCGGQVGLCADTGNAEATADKYATLARLLPQAMSPLSASVEICQSIDLDLVRCV